MRNLVCFGILALALAWAAPATAADLSTVREVNLTGEAWMASSFEEKAAFLLGVEMMIATEQHLATRHLEDQQLDDARRKMPQVVPSPFARGWSREFESTTRAELIAKIDGYLDAHPQERGRHIFDIIWRELIAPKARRGR